jgi:hypothetical protein
MGYFFMATRRKSKIRPFLDARATHVIIKNFPSGDGGMLMVVHPKKKGKPRLIEFASSMNKPFGLDDVARYQWRD